MKKRLRLYEIPLSIGSTLFVDVFVRNNAVLTSVFGPLSGGRTHFSSHQAVDGTTL